MVTEASSSIHELSLDAERAGRRAKDWRLPALLVLITIASLAVRLAALAHWGIGAMDSEGTEYARIAQNLRAGIGYVGMTSPGLQLSFPPLFPLLIAAASLVTPNYEWAGRIVSLVFGCLLPLPVFGIASHLFNRRTGYVTALLAICYPVLVNLSMAVLVEGPYITILLLAVYLVLRALERPSIGKYCLVGGVFGLAYLTRQEAVAPLMIAVFMALCFTKGPFAERWKRVAALLAVFAAVALPEIVYLYQATGEIRLEGKGPLIYAEELRTAIGEKNKEANPDEWALHSIDANLQRTGVANRAQADVIRETRISFRQLTRIAKTGMQGNIPVLLEQLSSRWMASPFLFALAFVGVLRRPWDAPLVSSYVYVLLVPCAVIVAMFSVTWFIARFYFVLVPFLLIWAANGLVAVGLWTKASIEAVGWQWISPTVAKWMVPALLGLVVVLYPVKEVRSIWEFRQGSRATQGVKELGLWIGQQQKGNVRIMDRSTPLAFHANAQWVAFPYCDGDLALRFLDAAEVDYVVLRQGEKYAQYYQEWLTSGIPDSRAERVDLPSGLDGLGIKVVRWHRAGSGFSGDSNPTR
jgi:4-amino-4-deoxy-L-arabinose transferase-like glycosyltransferase